MKVGVIGGGLMGLALAQRITALGHSVTVFEQANQLGGLATYHNFGSFYWDRFYHVILPTDSYLIQFIKDIGLGGDLRWQTTQTGFFINQQFYSLNNSLDFLRFPPLGLVGKIRLAFTILYCSRINDWQRLEKIPLEHWLIKISGQETYNTIWKPLLLSKLGENFRRVSAVFIWSYVKRMFSARDSSAHKEQMGHVSGGYRAVFNRLEKLIFDSAGTIRTGVSVKQIAPHPARGLILTYNDQSEHFNKIIFTGPVNVLREVAAPELMNISDKGAEVEYLGVVCMVMVTRKPLVPYYIVNIADDRVPFTGIIGMSNVVSTEETNDFHVTYLPKYVLSNDPMLKESDEKIRALFIEGLRLMFPDFDMDAIESIHINRAFKVQPLQVINYSHIVPTCQTLNPDFYVLNTAQFVNNTLNNNEVIRTVDEFLKKYRGHFKQQNTQTEENHKIYDKGIKVNVS